MTLLFAELSAHYLQKPGFIRVAGLDFVLAGDTSKY
jgi:hypothetical protein